MNETKRVFFFGNGEADGDASMKNMLGGKGANLAEMTRIGIPVPPGFTISAYEAVKYGVGDSPLEASLLEEIDAALARVEKTLGIAFGDPANPLLLSIRSGARVSMPGMMDTVLNCGLNDTTVQGVIEQSGDARFAYDSYRRFVQMFGDVVMGVNHFYFEEELNALKDEAGVTEDTDLEAEQLRDLVGRYKKIIASRADAPFPEEPRDQLLRAIRAVFSSWHNKRAYSYRDMNAIPHDWGTAVNVQTMVFGNRGEDCATGVAFTRNPSTGEATFYGEWLPNAQGEDVVAGIRTPRPLRAIGERADESLEASMPEAYATLFELQKTLEEHYKDMQDLEFTIERGKVWILQTRTGKRTAAAAVRIAVEMANEGLISRDDAILRVDVGRIDALLHPAVDPDHAGDELAKGLPASPGAARGRLVFTAEEAETAAENGEDVVLVRTETSPEDIRGMQAAVAIVTARGGMTSHAAVVARQMGKTCIAGVGALNIDAKAKTVRIGDRAFGTDDVWTIDGATGRILGGDVPLVEAQLSDDFEEFMSWVDARRPIAIRTNADNGRDATLARNFGAQGIGLTRTEHMFFEGERINAMREMILSSTAEEKARALEKLRPFQRGDFEDIFRSMDGLAVTIRLLDPPLHEFLPTRHDDLVELAKRFEVEVEDVERLVAQLHESNPMLGHRGCRLGISSPVIYEMQARAIFDATIAVAGDGVDPYPEIMVPLVSMHEELAEIRGRIERIRDEEYAEHRDLLSRIKIGTMIELPRACAMADKIAEYADFISFGTNDLTQTVYGFSRDDTSSFLPTYIERGLLKGDPFVSLDTEGVGIFIKMACGRARSTNPTIKIGICGEHGGDPASVTWVQRGLVNYVSCSPYRVPIARLASAQGAIMNERAGIGHH